MLVLEIVLVLIGLIAVGISFKLSDYNSGAAGKVLSDTHTIEEMEEEWERLREEIILYKEEILESASDELSRLSNDKLLGMDEYSGQVLERMNKNHEEVVFLYDMLKEKEAEIKDLVHHVDSVKAQIHDETAQEYQKMMEALKLLQEKRLSVESVRGGTGVENVLSKTYGDSGDVHLDRKDIESAAIPSDSGVAGKVRQPGVSSVRNAAERGQMPIEATQAKHLAESARELSVPQEKQKVSPSAQKTAVQEKKQKVNHNQEIINLYKKGHSVLEISKLLSLGQGEVKFVIDLFENR